MERGIEEEEGVGGRERGKEVEVCGAMKGGGRRGGSEDGGKEVGECRERKGRGRVEE